MKNAPRRGFHPTLRLALALGLALAVADQGAAATFTVTGLADSGPGSLRQAVLAANAAVGADEIRFEPGLSGTITLTSGEIAIMDHLVITGPGAGVLTVSGNNNSRIFRVDNGAAGAIDVTLFGLTLTQGYAMGPGGAVLGAGENLIIRSSVISDSLSEQTSVPETGCSGGNIAAGSLRIEHSTITGGVATALDGSSKGGNICAGNPTLERSTVSGGSADFGGGLYGRGLIYRSTISGNTARFGGGLYGTPTLEESTVVGNTAAELGGGICFGTIWFEGAVISCTISGNSARIGGGIYVGGGGHFPVSALVQHTTVSHNTAIVRGGGIARGVADVASFFIDHSILANSLPEDVNSEDLDVFETNHSLIETTNGNFSGFNNIVGVDPLLGPLADNGGPTLTYALLPGSPAIDAGDPNIGGDPNLPDPPATDQRGFARIVGPAIDLGSVEAQEGIVQVPTLSQLGLLLLSALLLAIGMWRLRS